MKEIFSLLLSNENSNIISGRGFSSKTKALFKLGTELCLDNMHALLAAACSYTFTLTHLHSGNLFIYTIIYLYIYIDIVDSIEPDAGRAYTLKRQKQNKCFVVGTGEK